MTDEIKFKPYLAQDIDIKMRFRMLEFGMKTLNEEEFEKLLDHVRKFDEVRK